jgi:hypothetical protein
MNDIHTAVQLFKACWVIVQQSSESMLFIARVRVSDWLAGTNLEPYLYVCSCASEVT